MPKTICELCNKEFSYKGGVATICKRKKCLEKKEKMSKDYQKEYRKKTKHEFEKMREKMREEMERSKEEVDKEYRERAGMFPKAKYGSYYALALQKDEKKDWSSWKPENTKGEKVESKTVHNKGGVTRISYTSKRIKT